MLIYKVTNLLDNRAYIGKRELSEEKFLRSKYYGKRR